MSIFDDSSRSLIRPLLLFSLFFVTSKLQKLRGQVKKIWAKNKVLPTSSSSSGDSVFQALNWCFSLQHSGECFISAANIKNRGKKKWYARPTWLKEKTMLVSRRIVVESTAHDWTVWNSGIWIPRFSKRLRRSAGRDSHRTSAKL